MPGTDWIASAPMIVPALCVGMHPLTLCVSLRTPQNLCLRWDAERPGRHSHAERVNDQHYLPPQAPFLSLPTVQSPEKPPKSAQTQALPKAGAHRKLC
ncbi:hypothetical protein EC919_12031 [Pseudomonas graminis]|nr:hypothetical protein EC919_12031 [Pseudomonas graminis]